MNPGGTEGRDGALNPSSDGVGGETPGNGRLGLFRLVWPVLLLSMAYSYFYGCENQWFNSYVQNVVLYDLPDRAFYVAFMGSCSAIFGLIFYILFGAVSDAKDPEKPPKGKRRPFAVGAMVAGVAMVLVPFQGSYWSVWFLDVVVIGIAANAGLIARDAIIPDIVEEGRRGRVNGFVGIAEAIGAGVVFALSAILIIKLPDLATGVNPDPNGPLRHALVIVPAGAGLTFAGVLFFAFIREKKTRGKNWEPRDWKEIVRENFNREEMMKPENRTFLKFFAIRLVVTIGDKIYLPYLIIFITARAGEFLTAAAVVALVVVFASATIVALVVMPRFIDKVGRKRVTIPAAAATGVGFVVFSLFLRASLLPAAVGLFLGVAGSQVFTIATRTWSQDLLPEEKRGNFLGILNISSTATQVPGLYIGAAVLTYLGMEWVFLAAGLFYLAFFPLFFLVPDYYMEAPRGKVRQAPQSGGS
ncbi:MAG: MFS transporter [Promethearchaeota archaeon]